MSTNDFAQMTALVVDDQEFVRNIVSTMLSQAGFGTILTAEDGGQALDIVREKRPTVVVCDIKMGPVDGFAFVQDLRNSDDPIDRETPIIFLTSHGENELVNRATQLGVTGFVLKPATVNKMKEQILIAIGETAEA